MLSEWAVAIWPIGGRTNAVRQPLYVGAHHEYERRGVMDELLVLMGDVWLDMIPLRVGGQSSLALGKDFRIVPGQDLEQSLFLSGAFRALAAQIEDSNHVAYWMDGRA